jgi:XTP/dITP diphosphohydrolase
MVRFPDGSELIADGVVEGRIARKTCGVNGFGYDPIFVPDEGDGRSFAEMDGDEKHAISHRGRALRSLAAQLNATGTR